MGGDYIATASEDSTVKLWNTGSGKMLKSFRGGSSNVILGLDIFGPLVAACGTDKMCRIWNARTERLVREYGVTIVLFKHGETFFLNLPHSCFCFVQLIL